MRTDGRQGIGTLLARNWWTVALRGAIAILFGIAVFLLPGIALATLVLLFGVFIFIGGILALIAAFRNRQADERRWFLLLEGIMGIIAGLVAFFAPIFTGVLLTYIIAAWAIFTGVLEIIAAIELRREIENEWLLALAGILSILFGIFLAIYPISGALAILWVVGVYAIIFGVMLLVLAFRLRNWQKQQSPPVL